MAWITLSDADAAVVEEIESQTDRGAAVVAAAFVEERLLQAIQARMHQDPDPGVVERVFDGMGPLASFSAKIDMGYLLEIYPEQIHWLLRQMRDIRNRFAHDMQPITFDSDPSIAAKLANMAGALNSACGHGIGFLGIASMGTKASGMPHTWLPSGKWSPDTPESPREAYIASAKVLLFILTKGRDVYLADNRPPPAPWRGKFSPRPPQPVRFPSEDRKRRKRPPEPSQE